MEKKLIKLIRETFGADSGKFDGDTKLMELEEWDSLRHMEFILALENEFGIQLTGDEIAAMEKIEQIAHMVRRKLSLT